MNLEIFVNDTKKLQLTPHLYNLSFKPTLNYRLFKLEIFLKNCQEYP